MYVQFKYTSRSYYKPFNTIAVAHGIKLSLKPIRNQIFMFKIYRKHILIQSCMQGLFYGK
jgi:hypothetical protein